jgi:hypothetical protein
MKRIEPGYYHVRPTGVNNVLSQDVDDFQSALGVVLCVGCGAPLNPSGPSNVKIQGSRVRSRMMSFIWGSGLIVASQRFLELIPEKILETELLLGTVIDGFGDRLDGWSTVKARTRVMIRGKRSAQTRVCSLCGRRLYYAAGKHYLYPAPAIGRGVFESNKAGLVFPESVFMKMAIVPGNGFGIERLSVLDSPRDGLGDFELL